MTGRAGDKTKSLGLDWPHTEKIRQLREPQSGTHWGSARQAGSSTPGCTSQECQSWGREARMVGSEMNCTNRVKWQALVDNLHVHSNSTRNRED